MTIDTVAILSPGEMGAAVGKALHSHGHDVVTWLGGRSGPTREGAKAAGFREAASLEALPLNANGKLDRPKLRALL